MKKSESAGQIVLNQKIDEFPRGFNINRSQNLLYILRAYGIAGQSDYLLQRALGVAQAAVGIDGNQAQGVFVSPHVLARGDRPKPRHDFRNREFAKIKSLDAR